jgi:hypothetical protein
LAGYTNNITEDLAFDIGYLRTFYPGGNSAFDFNDFYGTLMYKGISAGLSYSDDFFGETGTALYGFIAYDTKLLVMFRFTLKLVTQEIEAVIS